jgi:hypothetical protein
MFFVPLAPTGDVTVMVVVEDAPPATVTFVGAKVAVQPAEPPWKLAPIVHVREPQPGASGFVTVTV